MINFNINSLQCHIKIKYVKQEKRIFFFLMPKYRSFKQGKLDILPTQLSETDYL